ncbi:MAG: hypothetical protein ACK4JE_05340 [Endomicrobiia bacterium]
MNIKSLIFRSFFILLFVASFVFGWGYQTHRIINYYAIKYLPAVMENFRIHADYLSLHSSDPDDWKEFVPGEPVRHYIDLDVFEPEPFDNLPKKYEEFVEKYTAEEVEENGLLPWVIIEYLDLMTINMKKNRWPEVFACAYALGHYVADAHQPLHTTMNYDGQYTGDTGIHERYESTMINFYLDEIKIEKIKKIKYISNPLDFVFDFLKDSYSKIGPILDADTKYKKYFEKEPEKYYEFLWKDTKKITQEQINKAIYAFCCLCYTAWVNAGKPKIPNIKENKLLPIIQDEIEWRRLRKN